MLRRLTTSLPRVVRTCTATPIRAALVPVSTASSASATSLPNSTRVFSTTPSPSSSPSPNPNFQHLLSTRHAHVHHITLNRSALHNAFNEDVIAEITEAFKQVSQDEHVRCVILTGAGVSFSAGADLNWMKKMKDYTQQENQEDANKLFEMVNAIRMCPVPVIGRINGSALGGGCGLVAACDLSVAISSAKFGLTEVKLGLAPAVISRFVMDKIGASNAARYFLTGQRFDATTAQQIGLVHAVVETEVELNAMVQEWQQEILSSGPAAVRASKRLIREVSHMSVEQSQPYVTQLIASLRTSPEGQEGVSSFLEKRRPTYNLVPAKPKPSKL